VVLWCCSDVMLYSGGAVVLWCCSAVVWCCSAVVLWCCSAVVWFCGAVRMTGHWILRGFMPSRDRMTQINIFN